MTDRDTEQFERILDKALELQEKGESVPEILSLFAEYEEELKEIFQSVQILTVEKEMAAPPKELLTKIISLAYSKSVTNLENSRYLYRGTTKGRPSMIEEVGKETEFMLTKWKILLPVGIAVFIVLVFTAAQFTGRKTSTYLSLNEITKEQESINNLGAETDQYVNEETSFHDVNSALEEAVTGKTAVATPAPTQAQKSKQSPAPIVKPSSQKDPFGADSIQAESKKADFDSGVNSFSSEETGLQEINSALSDF